MLTIWKFNLNPETKTVIEAPAPARVLSAGLDPAGRPSVWVEVDPEARLVTRQVFLYGTGHHITSDTAQFVGSILDGAFVWHVYADSEGGQ